MSEPVYRDDAYCRETPATVTAVDDRGVILDRTVFYARGGGQILVSESINGVGAGVVHVPAPGQEAALAGLCPGDRVIIVFT